MNTVASKVAANGWAKISVVAVLCCIAALMLPGTARATFINEYPFGLIHSAPSNAGLNYYGTAALAASSGLISIDGVSYRTTTTLNSSGHWVYSETGPDANGSYKGKWTWVTDPARTNQAALACYPAGAAVSEATHTVVASARTAAGVTLTDTWSYKVAVPPIFGSPLPAAGSRVKTPMPAITVPVSDNTGVASVSAMVNGNPATAILSSGKVIVTGFTLSADGTVTVSVTARDAAGNSATKPWSFTLSYYTNLGCVAGACHGTIYNNDLAMGIDCVSCHPNVDHTVGHDASPASQTITISGVALGVHACSECHTPLNLVTLHNNVCATCHPSPKNTLTPAWNKSCAQGGCHTSGSTAPMHANIDPAHVYPADKASCLVSGCHAAGSYIPFAGKSVAEIHSSATTTTPSGTRASCQICHTPGITPTTDCVSSGCHPDRAQPHGYTAAKHTSTVTTGTITILGTDYANQECADCHVLELGPLHVPPGSCSTCHPSLVPIAGGWNKGCVQAGCHPVGSALQMHGSVDASHAVPASACTASGCHAGAGSLAAIHSSASTSTPGGTLTSCEICHAAGRTPSSACSDCHDLADPHGDMTAKHAATPASETITISGVSFGKRECSDCHAPTNLLNLHGSACATCHPSPKSTLTPAWDRSCAQGGCHTSGSTAPMHANIDPAHVYPADKAGCLIAGCHDSGGEIPFAGKSVAEIHSSATTTTPSGTRTSCQICHASGIAPTTDCLSSGCHPDRADPHGYSVAKHSSKVTTQTITILGTPYANQACADCHELELGPLHMPPATCWTCHPSLAPIAGGWNGTCVEAGCHPVGSPLAMHGSVDASHTRPAEPAAADSCFTALCHSGGNSLADIHATKQSCATCHGGGKTPTADCSAAGCHSNIDDPHPDVAAKHVSSGGFDFVSNGLDDGDHFNYTLGIDANCSQCHQTDLMALHSSDCVACHASTARSEVKQAVANHVTDCTACHPDHHRGAIPSHASHSLEDCFRCHNQDPYGGDPGDVSCDLCHP